MAKKTFNIKSTLAVQPKQLSADDVESAIKQIHESKDAANKAEQQIAVVNSPTVIKSNKIAETPVAAAPVVKKVRLSVDINPATHKKLKIKAIEHDSDIMHYVEMLIERDLGT